MIYDRRRLHRPNLINSGLGGLRKSRKEKKDIPPLSNGTTSTLRYARPLSPTHVGGGRQTFLSLLAILAPLAPYICSIAFCTQASTELLG